MHIYIYIHIHYIYSYSYIYIYIYISIYIYLGAQAAGPDRVRRGGRAGAERRPRGLR